MPRPWIVPPHDPLLELEPNLWVVEGDIPGTRNARRRMTVVRRTDGRLVFWNAVPVDDATLERLRAIGAPGFLVVPNAFHGIDVHPFREKLGVRLLCSPRARARISARAEVDGELDECCDDSIAVEVLPRTRQGECVLIARSPAGTSLAFGDAFMNVGRGESFVMDLLRFSGRPKCPPVFRLAFLGDRKAVGAVFRRLADLPDLRRLIPSHGAIVDQHVSEILVEVAARDLGRPTEL